MVGLPAAGKAARAKKLAAEHRALRLTPDSGPATSGRRCAGLAASAEAASQVV
jgi:hypothetical protein